MSARGPHTSRRRGVSLLETVVVIVALGVSVPPTVAWLGQSAGRQADAVNTLRATALATAVMEQVIADVASDVPTMGMSALDLPGSYLDTPVSGLRARMAGVAGPYEAMGMSYSVLVGPKVDAALGVNVDETKNRFRVVTITATFVTAAGERQPVAVSAVVSDL